jgi:hypothetical protein
MRIVTVMICVDGAVTERCGPSLSVTRNSPRPYSRSFTRYT